MKINQNPNVKKLETQEVGTQYIPKDYIEVAKSQEANFLKIMFEEMHNTVDKSEPMSSAEDIYQSMLTDERAQMMASHPDGVGIKKLILDQIYPQKYRTQEGLQAYDTMMQRNKKPRE